MKIEIKKIFNSFLNKISQLNNLNLLIFNHKFYKNNKIDRFKLQNHNYFYNNFKKRY